MTFDYAASTQAAIDSLDANERATAEAVGASYWAYATARDAEAVIGYTPNFLWRIEIDCEHIGDPGREHATQVQCYRVRDEEGCSLGCGVLEDGTVLPAYAQTFAERLLAKSPQGILY